MSFSTAAEEAFYRHIDHCEKCVRCKTADRWFGSDYCDLGRALLEEMVRAKDRTAAVN